MRYFLLFSVLLIPCAGFLSYFICGHCRQHVEESLTLSARKALDKAKLQHVNVEFDHLDASLSGSVQGSAERKKVTSLIAGLDGARLLQANNRLLIGAAVVSKPEVEPVEIPLAETAPSDPPPAEVIAPPKKAAISVRYDEDVVTLHGQVPNEATKQAILEGVKVAKPDHSINDQLVVESDVEVPVWEEGIDGMLRSFMPEVGKGQLIVDEKGAVLVGQVPNDDTRKRLEDQAATWLGAESLVNSQLEVVVATPVVDQKQALLDVFKTNAIYFASGSKSVETKDIPKLRKIAESVKANPGVRLFVGGYADKSGNPAANRRLSLDRATRVKNQLVKLGVAEEALVVESFGAEEMSVDQAWKSRRVELSIQE